jgi:hypothetical protein
MPVLVSGLMTAAVNIIANSPTKSRRCQILFSG